MADPKQLAFASACNSKSDLQSRVIEKPNQSDGALIGSIHLDKQEEELK